MMVDGIDWPADCDALTIDYRANGSFSFGDDRGRWVLADAVLTETMIKHDAPMETEDEEDIVQVDKPFVSKLRWNGSDRFWKRYSDGEIIEFRRCPKPRES